MNWKNVRLIFAREIRDQLRDRRTMFMICVMPALLYPMLGMSFMMVIQFMKETPSKVLFIGADHLPDDPPLLEDDGFDGQWFLAPGDRELLEVEFRSDGRAIASGEGVEAVEPPAFDIESVAREAIDEGSYDLVRNHNFRIVASVGVVGSASLNATSTPGSGQLLGIEVDPTLAYIHRDGFELSLEQATFLPLAGLDNLERGLTAQPAPLWRVRAHFGF